VTERLWPELLEDLGAPGVYILLVEVGTFADILSLSAREVVRDGNLVTALKEVLGNVRAYEAGTTAQKYPHLVNILIRWGLRSP
jgi:hypothetical protein